jgi:hypothetical protein
MEERICGQLWNISRHKLMGQVPELGRTFLFHALILACAIMTDLKVTEQSQTTVTSFLEAAMSACIGYGQLMV